MFEYFGVVTLYRFHSCSSVKGNVIIKNYKVNVSMEDELNSRRDPRQLDKDEEAWFDEEEEEFIDIPFGTTLSSTTSTDTPLSATDRKIPYGSITATPPPSAMPLSSSPISDYSKFVSSLKPRTIAESPASLSTSTTSQGSYSPRPFTVGATLQSVLRNRAATTMASYSMPTITSVSWEGGGGRGGGGGAWTRSRAHQFLMSQQKIVH